jgi:hypothetical protein
METHHFRLGVLDDRAHGIAERWDIQAGLRRLIVNPKLTVIGQQLDLPSVLTIRIGLRLDVAKEVDVDWFARQLPQLLNCLRDERWLHCRATDRA